MDDNWMAEDNSNGIEPSAGNLLLLIGAASAVLSIAYLMPTIKGMVHCAMRSFIAAGLYLAGYHHAAYVVAILAVFALVASIESRIAETIAWPWVSGARLLTPLTSSFVAESTQPMSN